MPFTEDAGVVMSRFLDRDVMRSILDEVGRTAIAPDNVTAREILRPSQELHPPQPLPRPRSGSVVIGTVNIYYAAPPARRPKQ